MPHIHEKIDFTAEVFIVHNNKVLLRLHDKFNYWFSVGGHVELDEDPNQAALREVKEEVGLDVTLYDNRPKELAAMSDHRELIGPMFMNRHFTNAHHEHITFYYFATSKTDKIEQPETSEKSAGCRWFGKNELEDFNDGRIFPQTKIYALKALETLKS